MNITKCAREEIERMMSESRVDTLALSDTKVIGEREVVGDGK